MKYVFILYNNRRGRQVPPSFENNQRSNPRVSQVKRGGDSYMYLTNLNNNNDNNNDNLFIYLAKCYMVCKKFFTREQNNI